MAPVLQIQQAAAAAATVEVVDETAAAVGNGGAGTEMATDGKTLHPMFVDIDDDEYTDSVLEIHR